MFLICWKTNDPTAEPLLTMTPSMIVEGKWISRCCCCCRGFTSFLTSNLLSPCQAMRLHPRGRDRHPDITPSHDPELFFFPHIPRTRSSQSLQFSRNYQREGERDKKDRDSEKKGEKEALKVTTEDGYHVCVYSLSKHGWR